MALKIELLQKSHNRSNFDSNTPLLDNYIRSQSSQDVKRNLSACYVLVVDDLVLGYYTLSGNSIPRKEMPQAQVQKLPGSYHDLPTILLGRLAVDKSMQGKGYGAVLLSNALERCVQLAEQLGTLAIVVDPIDEKARRFYAKFGFILIPGNGKMFIPIATVRKWK